MAASYGTMGYTRILLVPGEAKALENADVHLDNGRTVGALTSEVLQTASGLRVGFVYFPELNKGTGRASEALCRDIAETVRELGAKSDMVAGVSPWGYFAEKSFLEKSPPPLDMLLGGGPGSGLSKTANGNRTLWLRPFAKGKTLTLVAIEHLPDQGNRTWTPKDYALRNVPLGDSMRNDPAIEALISKTKEGEEE